MAFRRQFNPVYKGSQEGEDYRGIPSVTQPDMNLSIRQLLDHHRRGLPVMESAYRDGEYFEEETDPEASIPIQPDYDLNDLEELRLENQRWKQEVIQNLEEDPEYVDHREKLAQPTVKGKIDLDRYDGAGNPRRRSVETGPQRSEDTEKPIQKEPSAQAEA